MGGGYQGGDQAGIHALPSKILQCCACVAWHSQNGRRMRMTAAATKKERERRNEMTSYDDDWKCREAPLRLLMEGSGIVATVWSISLLRVAVASDRCSLPIV